MSEGEKRTSELDVMGVSEGKGDIMARQTNKKVRKGTQAKGKAARKTQRKTGPEILLEGMHAIIDAVNTGKPLTVRRIAVIKPPAPMSASRIVKVRRQLNVSQAVLAALLAVSTKTVQAWEQDVRVPSGAALRLLNMADSKPEALMKLLRAS